jgi:hypothetical protein
MAGAMNVVVSRHKVKVVAVWDDLRRVIVEVACVVPVRTMAEVTTMTTMDGIHATDCWSHNTVMTAPVTGVDPESANPHRKSVPGVGVGGVPDGQKSNRKGGNAKAFDEA